MLKVNNIYVRYAMLSYAPYPTSNPNNPMLREGNTPSLIQNQVLVEGDNPNLNVDSSLVQDDNENVTIDSLVTDSSTGNGFSMNTVIVNTSVPILCSQIIASNITISTTKWLLITLTGELLYTSDDFAPGNTFTLNLKNTNIPTNTQFKLKALNSGNQPVSNVILVFDPDSTNSTNFMLKGTPLKANISYLGVTTI